eukprot:scaffold12388_cov122-Isochrysis_galbana.AAC.9
MAQEAPEEGDDPNFNFISDTNNLITIKQKGPTLREIRDTDMGAAITYLLLDLEGVDTEPDILDDGKKGPWPSATDGLNKEKGWETNGKGGGE